MLKPARHDPATPDSESDGRETNADADVIYYTYLELVDIRICTYR